VFLTRYDQGDQIKDNEKGRAGSIQGRIEDCMQNLCMKT
jgi:hypothetical protein